MKVKNKGLISSKNSSKALNGSFTVEASIIIPLIFFIIFALFYLGFYLFDINRIQAVINNSMNKSGLTIKNEVNPINGDIYYNKIKDRPVFSIFSQSNIELENNINNYINNELNPGLFIMDIKKSKIKITNNQMKIIIVTRPKISQRGIIKLFGPNREVTYEGTYRIYNPTDFIRKAEIVLDTTLRIKGLDELKENMGKMLR